MNDLVIKAINDVYGTLESGLTESCYQKALVIRLREDFPIIEVEKSIPITYKNQQIASCRADIVIENKVILELKAVTTKLSNKDENQILRYMKILKISHGILCNFGPNLEIKQLEI